MNYIVTHKSIFVMIFIYVTFGIQHFFRDSTVTNYFEATNYNGKTSKDIQFVEWENPEKKLYSCII